MSAHADVPRPLGGRPAFGGDAIESPVRRYS
jgi:hypothetical protein